MKGPEYFLYKKLGMKRVTVKTRWAFRKSVPKASVFAVNPALAPEITVILMQPYMKIRLFIPVSFLASCWLFISYPAAAQENLAANEKKKENRWFLHREWAKGLALKPHKQVNRFAFYKQYHANQVLWDTAFGFLRTQDLHALKPGKYNLLGEQVFATVTEAATKAKDSVLWESHKKYIDLQYILEGKEMIGVADATRARVIKPYTFDAMNYETEGAFYISDPSVFFIFFPTDAHRPSIRTKGSDRVKKIVIKIEVAGD